MLRLVSLQSLQQGGGLRGIWKRDGKGGSFAHGMANAGGALKMGAEYVSSIMKEDGKGDNFASRVANEGEALKEGTEEYAAFIDRLDAALLKLAAMSDNTGVGFDVAVAGQDEVEDAVDGQDDIDDAVNGQDEVGDADAGQDDVEDAVAAQDDVKDADAAQDDIGDAVAAQDDVEDADAAQEDIDDAVAAQDDVEDADAAQDDIEDADKPKGGGRKSPPEGTKRGKEDKQKDNLEMVVRFKAVDSVSYVNA